MLVTVLKETYRLFDAFAEYDGSELFVETRTCGCTGSDTCSRCRTEEEDDRYWDERRREMDDEHYEPNEIEYCHD